jgi:hypothetical protein
MAIKDLRFHRLDNLFLFFVRERQIIEIAVKNKQRHTAERIRNDAQIAVGEFEKREIGVIFEAENGRERKRSAGQRVREIIKGKDKSQSDRNNATD